MRHFKRAKNAISKASSSGKSSNSATTMGVPRSVFAHFIVGVSAEYTLDDWRTDISEAQTAGIDGFALNIGVTDPCNDTQLSNAYSVAEELGYKVFLSFDYLAPGPWEASAVIARVQKHANSPAQYRVNGLPLVSTFEGTSNGSDWPAIRAAVSICFMPCWTSVGPFSPLMQYVDGAFSWDAWPHGATDKTIDADKTWKSALAPKAFMMGISPWFYTNLPRYEKNWLWRGDDMWHYRWQHAMDLQPSFVQIISWNDWGESHYVGPIHSTGMPGITPEDPRGAHRYVDDMPHDHWRDLLPYYIEAYKNGRPPNVTSEKLHFWYRLTPASAGSSDGTVGGAPYEPSTPPNDVVQDKIFFTALLQNPAIVTLQIGANPPDTFSSTSPGVFHSSTPLRGRTGAVTLCISRNGSVVKSAVGEAITPRPPNGKTNYNAWVGGLD